MELFEVVSVNPNFVYLENLEGRKLEVNLARIDETLEFKVRQLYKVDPEQVTRFLTLTQFTRHIPTRFEALAFAMKLAYNRTIDKFSRGEL